MCTKTLATVDYVKDEDVDILVLTETRIRSDGRNQIVEGDICPNVYTHVEREYDKGGGAGLLYKSNIKIPKVNSQPHKCFHLTEARLISNDHKPTLIFVAFLLYSESIQQWAALPGK